MYYEMWEKRKRKCIFLIITSGLLLCQNIIPTYVTHILTVTALVLCGIELIFTTIGLFSSAESKNFYFLKKAFYMLPYLFLFLLIDIIITKTTIPANIVYFICIAGMSIAIIIDSLRF